MISGFIFDFDGLMLDTEQPHFDAWQRKFSEYGFALSMDDWSKIVGTGPSAYSPADDLYNRTHGTLDRAAAKAWVGQYTDRYLEGQALLPGVESFIRRAHDQGYKLAIASSSDYAWVAPFLERFQIAPLFEAVLTARDVEHVKPDPALYNLAVEKLGLSAASVVAFEDSRNGVTAAKAAGLYCVAVPNRITRSMDLSHADRIVDSFTRLTTEEFSRIEL